MKYSALTWVKATIDENLKQTRQALEQFVENQDDTTPLQQCVTWLHEIRGALGIMELQTAALLVQNVEATITALLAGKINDNKGKEKAYDLLMNSLIQLPNYLDHLTIVQRDIPLALLPLINGLRAMRGQKPLPANQLFTPDLTVTLPGVKPVQLPDPKLKDYAQKMRVAYHKGLGVIVKNPKQATEGIKYIHNVMQKMQQATGTHEVTKVWWVTEAVLESLLLKGLELNANIINALKQVDAVIKQIVDHGNAALRQPAPRALLTNLLYFSAHAHAKGKQLQKIKAVFKLQDYFPSESALQSARLTFSGPDIELMKTVVTLLKDDFARIEETLDIFNRADNPTVSELTPLVSLLTDMANTLGLLGLPTHRNSMIVQARMIKEVIDGKRSSELNSLLEIGNALLKIDSALDILGVQGVHARQRLQQSPDTEFSETPQFGIILSVVVNEAKIELSQVIQPLVSFISDPTQLDETLLEVPERLKQVEGFLSILSHDRASLLLRKCNQYIQKVFIKEKTVPEEAKLKALADTLISIELYLDTLAGNPMDADEILNTTQKRLALLTK
jgi:chemosensory pili system protein ChpA (sensor histidine kinase/response regulator)